MSECLHQASVKGSSQAWLNGRGGLRREVRARPRAFCSEEDSEQKIGDGKELKHHPISLLQTP